MPRPPVLVPIDWRNVLETGKTFEEWIAAAEFPENADRMKQSVETLRLEPAAEAFLRGVKRRVHVVAFAEDWCGDVVRHVPALRVIERAGPNISVRYFAREDHPRVFERFLTNGGEAVPKFVFLSEELVECGNWGPMPACCRELVSRGKACGNVPAARERVAACYKSDPELALVFKELLELIDIAGGTRFSDA